MLNLTAMLLGRGVRGRGWDFNGVRSSSVRKFQNITKYLKSENKVITKYSQFN
jgi:hypothetical protein